MGSFFRSGLTLRQGVGDVWLKEMREVTGDRCWICLQPEKVPNRSLSIDHCHKTDTVRGLLCGRCNLTLGRVGDDPELLRKMALYLETSRGGYYPFGEEVPVEPAKITHVAVVFREDIYSLPAPNRHHHVIDKIRRTVGEEPRDVRWRDEGFLDERGVYLNRRQALLSARAMDQIKSGTTVKGDSLFSVYLW